MASEKRPKPLAFSDRRTLDGPWEWAYDRMMANLQAKKRAADALAAPPKPKAKPKAKVSASRRK